MIKITIEKFKWRNFPIYLVFYILPVISFIYELIFHIHLNYEVVWLLIIPSIIVVSKKKNISKQSYLLLSIIVLLCLIKYVAPLFWVKQVVYRAWLLDFKWIYYLLLAILWINLVGKPNISTIYNGGRFFAIFYIISIVIKTIIAGNFSRSNAALIGECNYDCFLLLIPFCFISKYPKRHNDYLLYSLAALMSTSKTGVMSLAVLLIYPKYKTSKYKPFFLIMGIAICILWVDIFFLNRGLNNFEDVDRIVFFMQFFEYLNDCNYKDLILGYFPGSPMDINIIDEFSWYIHEFQTINSIKGCFPFYFHSTYMRLSIVWGIPAVIVLIMCMIYLFKTSKYIPLENLILLFFLESISLSTLSLVNVSFIFIISFLCAYSESLKKEKLISNDSK